MMMREVGKPNTKKKKIPTRNPKVKVT